MHATAVSEQDFVWLAGSLCRINRLPFDPQLLLQKFPPPHSVRQFLEAAGALGFRTGASRAVPGRLDVASFPCVGFLTGDPVRPAILAQADADRLLYFTPERQEPQTCPLGGFGERFTPDLVLLRHESRADAGDTGDGAPVKQAFGFRWFARELLRHRGIWRNVLLASFFIQLVGLTTPLFTQVIIDKVVVHHTESTLMVVAAGLVMFMLFNAGMSWLRQYLVLHTGNRVDAVLGSQAFGHLLHLHLPYFEARPTGTLVARLHAVETIREFMAGAAVAVLLDIPFLFVFLAVMFAYSWQLTVIALALVRRHMVCDGAPLDLRPP